MTAGEPIPSVTLDELRSAYDELKRLERVVVTPPALTDRVKDLIAARGALANVRVVESVAVPEGKCLVLAPHELRRHLEAYRFDARWCIPPEESIRSAVQRIVNESM